MMHVDLTVKGFLVFLVIDVLNSLWFCHVWYNIVIDSFSDLVCECQELGFGEVDNWWTIPRSIRSYLGLFFIFPSSRRPTQVVLLPQSLLNASKDHICRLGWFLDDHSLHKVVYFAHSFLIVKFVEDIPGTTTLHLHVWNLLLARIGLLNARIRLLYHCVLCGLELLRIDVCECWWFVFSLILL